MIGVISDTHGLVRPEALAALARSELIIHAGDIGAPIVLDALRQIAPVVAVRGNNDQDAWAESLPETRAVTFRGISIYVLHNLKELDADDLNARVRVVISGHSHQPLIEKKDGRLFLNPGSAGPRRFRLPVSVALLRIKSGKIDGELRTLL